MTREELLDHVANLLKQEADKGPGVVLLCFEDDFKTIRLEIANEKIGELIGIYECELIKSGLPPSVWLALSKKIWTVISLRKVVKGAIKFNGSVIRKALKKPPDTDKPPRAS